MFAIGVFVGAMLMVLYYRHHNRSSFDDLPDRCDACGRPAVFAVVTSDIATRTWVEQEILCVPCYEYLSQIEPPWCELDNSSGAS